MDYSKLSDADLLAYSKKNYAAMSDDGLKYIRDQKRSEGNVVSSSSIESEHPGLLSQAGTVFGAARLGLRHNPAFSSFAESLIVPNTDTPTRRAKKLLGGMASGATLGLVAPYKDDPSINESMDYAVGEMGAMLIPYAGASKGVSMIPKVGNWLASTKNVATAGQVVSNIGKAALRGTVIGGGVGEARQGVNALLGNETSQMEPVKDAAFFAAVDAGLSALGGFGKLMRAAIQRGRYADAEALYRKATAGMQQSFPEVEAYLAQMKNKPLQLTAPTGMSPEGFTLVPTGAPSSELRKARAFIDGRVYNEGEQLPVAFAPGMSAEAPLAPKETPQNLSKPLEDVKKTPASAVDAGVTESLPPVKPKEAWEMTRGEYIASKPKVEPLSAKRQNEDYAGQHEAPMSDSGSPLHDLVSSGAYPEDVYGPNGLRYYSTGDKMDALAYSQIRAFKDKPNAAITVYRAVPKNVVGVGKKIIQAGDWVTTVRDYAKEHGQGALRNQYRIVSKKVKARDLFTNGDSWMEWGYDPQPENIAGRHRTLVGQALKSNKPVPASVLADYPELAKKYGRGENLAFQAAAGATTGLYYDQDEKKWKYNPALGAVGALGGMAVGRIVEGKGTKIEKNVSPVHVEEVLKTEKYDVSAQGKATLNDAAKAIGPQLEKIKKGPLTHDEVIEAAKGAEILKGQTTRAEALKIEAMLLRTKEHLSHLAETQGEVGASREMIDAIKNISTLGTYGGRLVESMKLTAGPDEFTATRNKLIKKLLDLGHETDAIVEAAKNVNFNDAEQVTKFYRTFVKPRFGEIIDEYRYINLLSSPRTHIVNAFSNALQVAGLRPATRLVSGVVDNVASSMTGKAREFYVRQVPAYYKGVINSTSKGLSDAWDVMLGKSQIRRPDLEHIPTGSKLVKFGQPIPRALEAMDILFRTMAAGGEAEALAKRAQLAGKEITQAELRQLSEKEAEKLVFRAKLDPSNESGQGYVLSKIDAFTNWVGQGRKFWPVKWFVPFIQTPTQILKQGLEYSPLGIGTLPKNAAKLEQLSKAIVGSTVFAGGGMLALQGRTTWAVPTNAKQKAAFYAAGMQPYSVKIGDTWYSYSKLGPLAYPLAMAAGIKQAFEDNPNALTETQMEKVKNALAGVAEFFADQSYVQGMQSLFNAVAQKEGGAAEALTQVPSQLIPLSALQRWVANIVDPIYRKGKTDLSPEAIIDQLKKGIPGLSKTVEPYLNDKGEPSQRPVAAVNAISPVGVSPEKPKEYADYKRLSELQQLAKYQSVQDENAKASIQKTKSTEQAIALLERETTIWQLKQDSKTGNLATSRSALKSGQISRQDFADIMRHRNDTKEVSAFRSLPMEYALSAYQSAEPSNKKLYRAILANKWQNYIKTAAQKDVTRLRPMVLAALRMEVTQTQR